jgi:two-component system sensor histidine kinase DesK
MLCSILAGATSAVAGANGGTVVSYVASAAGIGLLMLVMRDLRIRNAQLNEARAELAQMAVAQERERFARDLHDLLGHSLSVITLKAELAGRMLTDRPDDAAREVAELEQVARTALSEVRDAVSGYRQPTLDGELAGARMALSAAGIEAAVEEARVPLDSAVEAVLAWTIREGATNVIRHSHARHCTLRITASLTDAGVEVIDDGVGDDRAAAAGNGAGGAEPVRLGNGRAGHGLAGLAERARLLNGRLEAGATAGGGYRLAVTVPVSRP